MKPLLRQTLLLFAGLTLASACGFNSALREYLYRQFWMPFTKLPQDFRRPSRPDSATPYAGMAPVTASDSPLNRLRQEYRFHSQPGAALNRQPLLSLLAAARNAPNLSPRDREEIALIDAKLAIRAEAYPEALQKLGAFLRQAKDPAFASEARGWLAHVHLHNGNQSAAGKIYLDELNRRDSILSRDTLASSLYMTYGLNGGPKLLSQLEDYFDTPEHAAFAIQMATNPDAGDYRWYKSPPIPPAAIPYARIQALLQKHARLLQSNQGALSLGLLSMRTALRAGDPAAALLLAAQFPATAPLRRQPDFLWMHASAHFLTREYAAAAEPLLALYRSPLASLDQKAAAAYGLCGVYRKLGKPVEQIRYALWLSTQTPSGGNFIGTPGSLLEDMSIYWPVSGWDLALLLEIEAPLDALRDFLAAYPRAVGAHRVRYALAVRLARLDQYEESAAIYDELKVGYRARRMRQLAVLHAAAVTPAAKFALAEFLDQNQERIYFNDRLWDHLQSYVFQAETDSGLTAEERTRQIALERELKDVQEERWRAYELQRQVITEEGKTPLGRRAAQRAISYLRRIDPRFGREEEIRQGDIELSRWLR
jgi:hypothetical protein